VHAGAERVPAGVADRRGGERREQIADEERIPAVEVEVDRQIAVAARGGGGGETARWRLQRCNVEAAAL
jgi:hypothetical protein